MLYGLPVVPDDPGGLTAVPVTIGDASGWLNVARGITRVYQGGNTFGLPI